MADNAFLDLWRVRQSGRRAVLITVVNGFGPTYRHPGSSMVICDDGESIGAVSGGCLQADIKDAATQVLAGEGPRLLSYNSRDPEDLLFGSGSGCGGVVQLLVAPMPDDLLSAVVAALQDGRPAVLETVIAPGEALGTRRLCDNDCGAYGYRDDGAVFCQKVTPPTTLLVWGAGDDAQPLVRSAGVAGYRVIVADHRPAWATPERFPAADQVVICDREAFPAEIVLPPNSYAVLLTHNYEQDLHHVQALLERPMAYVGLLGSRDRCRKLISELLADRPDLEGAVRSTLRAPVGLDIGADGPAEIAVAIMAELIAHRAGRPASPLSLMQQEGEPWTSA